MFNKVFRFVCSLFLCAGIISNGWAAGSSSGSLLPRADIAVGDIPQFQLGKDLVLSPRFLKFCRLAMFTIPMDQKADDLELNRGIPVPITRCSTPLSGEIHPLQVAANRRLALGYIAGRNIVITAGGNPNDHLVFITGMGPKYGESEKKRLQVALGAQAFDIIDVLPKLPLEQKQAIRSIFIDTRNLMTILNILSRDVIREVDTDKILKLIEGISELAAPSVSDLKTFIELMNFEETESVQSKIFDEHRGTLETFLKLQKPKAKQACSDLLNGLLGIVASHLGATQRQTLVASEALSKMLGNIHKDDNYYKNLIMQITSLEPLVLSSSLAGLKLIDDENKNHERALGDLFHSEPLYTLWKTTNQNSAPYFFTQRDMCAVCDPHVCKYFSKGLLPFFVLSARVGNTPGEKSVDRIFFLADTRWQLRVPEDWSKIHYSEQPARVQRYLLRDLYSTRVLQTQKDNLIAKIISATDNFDDSQKAESNLKKCINDGIALGITADQLLGAISDLQEKNNSVWIKISSLI